MTDSVSTTVGGARVADQPVGGADDDSRIPAYPVADTADSVGSPYPAMDDPDADSLDAGRQEGRGGSGSAASGSGRVAGQVRRLPGWLAFLSRSLRLRVVVLTLVLSGVVMIGLGFVLQRQITEGLLANKKSAAISEIENARATATQQLVGAETNPTQLHAQLTRLQQSIGNPATSPDGNTQGSTSAGVFETVVVPIRPGDSAESLAVGPLEDVPAALQVRVAAGYEAAQYTTITRQDANGNSVRTPALVVGAPVTTRTTYDTFAVYLIFPLTSEENQLAVFRQTLLLGGGVLALALAAIAFLVAGSVLRPIRRASGVAQRFAAGDMTERMPVRGAVELTAMAKSFNGMADAIRAQIRQLEEFGRLQRRFTSDVSHELRTPLTTVRMAADTLHEGRDEFPPHLSRSTELLVDELDRFESLLGDLLEISRHDAGMAELNAEAVDVRSHVVACVAASGPFAAKTGVRIVTHLPPDPVIAAVDSRRLERILRNLLNNAVDHAEGGVVDVELANDAEALAIAVTDHGVGLKPGESGLVFNRFWRADPSRQRLTGGTGLGLAISLEDARLHGGWLQAYGQPGQGARFRLTLPLRQGALVSASPLPLRPDEDDEPDTGPATTLLRSTP